MRLSFDSVEELRAFVKSELKGAPRAKGGDDAGDAQVGNAPALAMPPAGAGPTYAPQVGGAGTLAGPGATAAFPGGMTAPPTPDPAVLGLVQRLNTRISVVISGDPSKGVPGQPAEQVAIWLRNQCAPTDPSAAAATLDQLQNVYLFKLGVPQLTEMARLMAA